MTADSPVIERSAYALLLALAFLLPFEVVGRTVPAFGFTWTNLEFVMLLFVGTVLLAGGRNLDFRSLQRINKWITVILLALALWLVLALLSAATAPALRPNALRATLRLAMGPFLLVCALVVLRSRSRRRGLLWALALGGGASALSGLLEWTHWPALEPVWHWFKESPGRVGGQLRVSGSFPFATTAAFYWELCTPLAVALAGTTRHPLTRGIALMLVILCTLAVLLTFARSGLLLIWLGVIATILLSLRHPRFAALRGPALVWLLSALLGTTLLATQSDIFRARLISENDLTWYRAQYDVPIQITIDASQPNPVRVTVTNRGQVAWQPAGERAIQLEGRWLTADGNALLDLPTRHVSLPESIAPGEARTLAVTLIQFPPDGDYQLTWGLVATDQFRFQQRGSPEATTRVEVVNSPATASPDQLGPPLVEPARPLTVARRDLWRAALSLWQERPVLGIGADNFRHLYGPALGLALWDDRLTANNLYLELLVGLGLSGLVLFLVIVGLVVGRLLVTWRHLSTTCRVVALGLSLGLGMVMVHGLVDVFLWQNGPNGLFWLILALGLSYPAPSTRR